MAKGGGGAWQTIKDTITGHVADAHQLERSAAVFIATVPAEQRGMVDTVLASTQLSYPAGLIIQLAYRLVLPGGADVTQRQTGGRGVSGRLGRLLIAAQIPAVPDAFQNIGKNEANLARGHFPEYDHLLRWASDPGTGDEQVYSAFDYVCARVAATARPVKPMPELDQGRLTFGRVMALIADLLGAGSQGVYEQLVVAALLTARIGDDPERLHVTTKRITASDRSSATAGDVQVRTGNEVVDAWEVTANDWNEKLPGAEKTIRDHDLARLTIVGRVGDPRAAIEALCALDYDVAALDIWPFCAEQVAAIRKPGRAAALQRLHGLLVRYQGDFAKVDRYVDLLVTHRLTTGT